MPVPHLPLLLQRRAVISPQAGQMYRSPCRPRLLNHRQGTIQRFFLLYRNPRWSSIVSPHLCLHNYREDIHSCGMLRNRNTKEKPPRSRIQNIFFFETYNLIINIRLVQCYREVIFKIAYEVYLKRNITGNVKLTLTASPP